MASLANIRSRLQSKVFEKLGSTVTVNYLTSSADKWGDVTTTATSSSSFSAVPFYTMVQDKTFNPFGTASEGDTDMIFEYTVVIAVGDTVTFDSRTYDVFAVEEYPYQNGNIATLVRLREQLN